MITSHLKQFGQWLDDHILLLLAGFLIAFIPLYPKLPLFEAIPGYIVRVRVEDILILGTAIVWFVQVLRRKVIWRTPLFWMMIAYAIVGFLSVLSAVFITKTVPAEALHVSKTALHYFRYLEYFSLFVIVFSAIKTRVQVKILLGIITVTVLAITLYGYGQKEYFWPVYSTMNREFSKGLRLYLTEHARVQSTFGGHYDLSAYLVVMLPILLSLSFLAKRLVVKLGLQAVHWLGLWLLVVSASRTSFLAYLVGLTLVVMLVAWQKQTWLQKLWWGTSRYLLVVTAVGIMMLYFGEDMYMRLLQVIDGYPAISQVYHRANGERKELIGDPASFIAGLTPETQKPENALSTNEALELETGGNVLVPTDERPVSVRPSDVYVDVPDIVEVATISASGAATTIKVDKGPRVYSDCALEKGLSLCIRLDTLWPRALAGFYANPFLGSGYATLTKEGVGQFTEAESTDNNFLRTLGETGLLGFLTFYGVVAVSMLYAVRLLRHDDNLGRALAIGYLGASVGLLLNAVYIDVFAASKVALSYWALCGIVLGYSWLILDVPNHLLPFKSSRELPVPLARTSKKSKSKKKRFKNHA